MADNRRGGALPRLSYSSTPLIRYLKIQYSTVLKVLLLVLKCG